MHAVNVSVWKATPVMGPHAWPHWGPNAGTRACTCPVAPASATPRHETVGSGTGGSRARVSLKPSAQASARSPGRDAMVFSPREVSDLVLSDGGDSHWDLRLQIFT